MTDFERRKIRWLNQDALANLERRRVQRDTAIISAEELHMRLQALEERIRIMDARWEAEMDRRRA